MLTVISRRTVRNVDLRSVGTSDLVQFFVDDFTSSGWNEKGNGWSI